MRTMRTTWTTRTAEPITSKLGGAEPGSRPISPVCIYGLDQPLAIQNWLTVTARTNASKVRLVDCYLTKILSRGEGKGAARTDVNKYVELAAKALVVGEPIIGCGRMWQHAAVFGR